MVMAGNWISEISFPEKIKIRRDLTNAYRKAGFFTIAGQGKKVFNTYWRPMSLMLVYVYLFLLLREEKRVMTTAEQSGLKEAGTTMVSY